MNFHIYIGSACDVVKANERRDWGWEEITKSQCENKGCCYDISIPYANNCFYKGTVFHIFLGNGIFQVCLSILQ